MERNATATENKKDQFSAMAFPGGLDRCSWKTLADATEAICAYHAIGAITIDHRDELLAHVLDSKTLTEPPRALIGIIRWNYKPKKKRKSRP